MDSLLLLDSLRHCLFSILRSTLSKTIHLACADGNGKLMNEQPDLSDGFEGKIMMELLQSCTEWEHSDYFSVPMLRQVMRCSENVFRLAYKESIWTQEFAASTGHKIQGEALF